MNILTPQCTSFVERLNRVLDGDAPQSSLLGDAHLTLCAGCQHRYRTAQAIAALRPLNICVPRRFADRILEQTRVVERSHPRKRLVARVGGFALAASMLVAVWLLRTPTPEPKLLATLPSTGVVKPLSEARDALVALTTTVASDSLAPAKSLLVAKASPASKVEEGPLADFPEAAKAGLEPLVNTPRRALNLFLRDVGGVANSRKSNS